MVSEWLNRASLSLGSYSRRLHLACSVPRALHSTPHRGRWVMAAAAAAAGGGAGWTALGTPTAELRLEFTLPTGQSFRWVKTGGDEYTGVVGQRVVRVRQLEGDVAYQVVARGSLAAPEQDAAVLRDYFNLETSLSALAREWCAADARFAAVHPYFQGARMLRQDPVECLFQFICSSNNHISRIHGMVERLCRRYGNPLHIAAAAAVAGEAGVLQGPETEAIVADQAAAGPAPAALAAASAAVLEVDSEEAAAAAARGAGGGGAPAAAPVSYYAFPTLEQLAEATEEALRDDGFGYRAKFITGSVAALLKKPGGGAAWLHSLRDVPYAEAVQELSALPGIGPKVAACVALFSLDKHEAIPVDTHVWALATRYYTPHLKGKSLTKKVHQEVQDAFAARFGPYCGWAHNTLFISELASMKDRLPPSGGRAASGSSPGAAAAAAAAEGGGSSQARKRQRKGSSSSAAADAAAPASEATSGEPEAALEAAAERAGGQRRPPAKAAGLGVAAEGTQQGLGAWRQRKAADLV